MLSRTGRSCVRSAGRSSVDYILSRIGVRDDRDRSRFVEQIGNGLSVRLTPEPSPRRRSGTLFNVLRNASLDLDALRLGVLADDGDDGVGVRDGSRDCHRFLVLANGWLADGWQRQPPAR